MAELKCGVVIPVYRQNLLETEVISLKQCCKQLADYPIIIITYKTLHIAEYIKILEEYNINYKIEYFSKMCFEGTAGYSALMFSDKFYKRFLCYEYILIYQLDAYIFTSNLDYWLEQGYDYIGGPALKEIRHTLEFKWTEYFNGGFCLRKTELFYRLCFTNTIKFNKVYCSLLQKNRSSKSMFVNICLTALYVFIRFIMQLSNITPKSEDFIWSDIIKQKGKAPSFNTALEFSFDNYPQYAFVLNNGKLPFGCHAWDVFYPYEFWKKYIEK
ncbi:MAG: hypothetical protein LBD20_07225 [Spirochaetaceae bacterium]|jgi:hypothetical protein|nr:hypothetical protein [Spirochaetaceae bacterium]